MCYDSVMLSGRLQTDIDDTPPDPSRPSGAPQLQTSEAGGQQSFSWDSQRAGRRCGQQQADARFSMPSFHGAGVHGVPSDQECSCLRHWAVLLWALITPAALTCQQLSATVPGLCLGFLALWWTFCACKRKHGTCTVRMRWQARMQVSVQGLYRNVGW